jgi:hypothetical protein
MWSIYNDSWLSDELLSFMASALFIVGKLCRETDAESNDKGSFSSLGREPWSDSSTIGGRI